MPSNRTELDANLFKFNYYAHIGKYYLPSNLNAVNSVILTLILYYITFKLENYNMFINFICVIFRSLIYVRFFVLMHDNGHEALFKSPKLNDICGCLMAGFMGVSYFNWKIRHNFHHKISNDLQYTQEGQSAPMQTNCFLGLKSWQQKLYLFLFSKFGMIFVLPTLYRIINVVTLIFKDQICLVICLLIQIYKIKYYDFWNDQIALELGALYGLLLFHAEHTFPTLKRKNNITHIEQGLLGATYLELPEILKFFYIWN